MQSDYTLNKYLVDRILSLKDNIKNTKDWDDPIYIKIFADIRQIRMDIHLSFKKQSGDSIEECIRQMVEGTFEGDLKLLNDHLNAYLFLYKMQQRVEWQQRYGNFPEQFNIK